jgi:hypothetical protein
MIKSARISPDGLYRYELRRTWDKTLPILEWIMLNPSTADAYVDDNTIKRCIAFARAWGYGGIVVRNLFAWRATNPAELLSANDPFGPDNAEFLNKKDAKTTVVAWGAHPMANRIWRAQTSWGKRELWCLGVNANGSPKHPLYVPSSRTLVPWEMRG